jgi:hypothetical protein
MNLREIREECWDQARELKSEDKLWPEEEMNRYINRIYRRIAEETFCIRDATTPAVCLISSAPLDHTTYTEGTLDYLLANDTASWLYQQDVAPLLHTLHASILRIDEVKWLSRGFTLHKVSAGKWMENAFWEQTIGVPTEYALDLETGKLAVNFRDQGSDTLKLCVRRLPLTTLTDDANIPEIPAAYHEAFMPGVLELMYAKKDSEVFDVDKALGYRGEFKYQLERIARLEIQREWRLQPTAVARAFR